MRVFDDIKISYLGWYWPDPIQIFCFQRKLINHAGDSPCVLGNNNALSKIVSPWGTLTPVDLVEDSSLPYRKVCVTTKVSTIINDRTSQEKISDNPFGIYNILNKQDNKEAGQDSDPSHPPGITQEVNVGVSVNLPVHSDMSPNIEGSQNVSGVNRSFSLKTGGSIMDVIENLVEVGQTMGYNMATECSKKKLRGYSSLS
ncbi:hypothetical protein Tco_0989395 [Tanacetum coccineum]|uniref:Uncharacterized protein n=1 Tax=Tanacetum coccineum TaxID=301880 RepID=A0ABQ5ETK7_9ASTR